MAFFSSGLCIPANNTLFIVGISEKLAAREPQLTLEVRERKTQNLFVSHSITLIRGLNGAIELRFASRPAK